MPFTEAGRRLLRRYEYDLTAPEVEKVEAEAYAAGVAAARAQMPGLSLPPGPDFAWVEGHMAFIDAALAAIDAIGVPGETP